MRLCFILALVFRVASAGVCVMCSPGKYKSALSNMLCVDCGVNTYSPVPGMTTCFTCEAHAESAAGRSQCECMQNYKRANSSAGCILECANGLEAVGPQCMKVLVLKMEMVLGLPQNLSTNEVEKAILSSMSIALNIPPENLVVAMVPASAASRRRLAQATSEVRFAVEVRVYLEAGASVAAVSEMQTKINSMNSTTLNAALQSAPNGVRVTVLQAVLQQSSEVTQTPSGGAATPSTPATTPSAPGVRPSAPGTTPSGVVPEQLSGFNIVPIAAGAGAGLAVVVGVIVACLCMKRKSVYVATVHGAFGYSA